MILHDTPRAAGFRGFKLTSHLMSDLLGTQGTDELDAFAVGIGLKPRWRQSSGTPTEHYDLFDGAVARARAAGSTEVSGRDLIIRVVRPKRDYRPAEARLVGEVECAACGEAVELVAEADAWTQVGGGWVVSGFGPGTGECCGRLYTAGLNGCEVFRLDQVEVASAG